MMLQSTNNAVKEEKQSTIGILRHIPGLILLCIIFAPPLRFLPSLLTAVRLEDFLLGPLAIRLILLKGRQDTPTSQPQDHFPVILAFIGLCGIVGMYIGILFYQFAFNVKDLILIPQIIKYILLYSLLKDLLTNSEIAQTTRYYVTISALFAVLISVAQFWNILDFNNWFTPLYISDEVRLSSIKNNLFWKWRISGTQVNANIYGTILVWQFIFVLVHYLAARAKKTISLYIFIIIGLLIAIAMTQSRTMLILVAMTVILGLFTENSSYIKKSSSNRIVILTIVLILAGIMLINYIDQSAGAFGSRLSFTSESTQTSLSARLRDLVGPTYEQMGKPLAYLLGTGPSKAVLRTDSHNGYSWILLRFGLIGLILYCVSQFMILTRASRVLRANGFQGNTMIARFVFVWIFAWIIVEFTNAPFKVPSLMGIYLFSAAWVSAEMQGRFTAKIPPDY